MLSHRLGRRRALQELRRDGASLANIKLGVIIVTVVLLILLEIASVAGFSMTAPRLIIQTFFATIFCLATIALFSPLSPSASAGFSATPAPVDDCSWL